MAVKCALSEFGTRLFWQHNATLSPIEQMHLAMPRSPLSDL